MPLDLEARKADSIQLADQLEQEQGTAKTNNGWLLEGAGASFLKKFTVAMDLARDSGVDMTRETYTALRADYLALGTTERYAVSSSLLGTFPEFNWFDRDEYDAFCNPQ